MQDLTQPSKEAEQIKPHQVAMFGGEVALREYLLQRYKKEDKRIPLGRDIELPGTLYTPMDASLPKIAVISSLTKAFCLEQPSCIAPDGETILIDKAKLNVSAFLSGDKDRPFISPESQRSHIQGKVEFELKYFQTEGDLFQAFSAQIKKTYNIQGDENVLRILEQGLDRVQFMLVVLHYAAGSREKIDRHFPSDPAPTTHERSVVEDYDRDVLIAAREYSGMITARSFKDRYGGQSALKIFNDFRTKRLPEEVEQIFRAKARDKYVDVLGDLHLAPKKN